MPLVNRQTSPMVVFLASSATSLFLGGTITTLVFPRSDRWIDWLAGWLAGTLVHGFSLILFRRAVGQPPNTFLGLAVGTIFTRLFLLIILLVIVLVGGFLQVGPFSIGLLTAYFIGSWTEIGSLARANSPGSGVGKSYQNINVSGDQQHGGRSQ
jgi:hypothetical protein